MSTCRGKDQTLVEFVQEKLDDCERAKTQLRRNLEDCQDAILDFTQRPYAGHHTEGGLQGLRSGLEEGWSPEHDDGHDLGELPAAAAAYAWEASQPMPKGTWAPSFWPWDQKWWKTGTVRRMLIKAAALIVAEIERLDRKGDSS